MVASYGLILHSTHNGILYYHVPNQYEDTERMSSNSNTMYAYNAYTKKQTARCQCWRKVVFHLMIWILRYLYGGSKQKAIQT